MTEPVSPAHGIERFSNEPLTAARGTESVKAMTPRCARLHTYEPMIIIRLLEVSSIPTIVFNMMRFTRMEVNSIINCFSTLLWPV